jgi:ferredoxin
VALDAVACRIIGLKPGDVLTTRFAAERGLGIGDLGKITIVGEKYDSFIVNHFKLPVAATGAAVNRAPHRLVKYILEQISIRTRVIKKNCTACAKCVKACPTGAIAMVGKTSAINDKLCIRCMCCDEVCRFNAIYPGRPFLGTILYGIIRAVRRK